MLVLDPARAEKLLQIAYVVLHERVPGLRRQALLGALPPASPCATRCPEGELRSLTSAGTGECAIAYAGGPLAYLVADRWASAAATGVAASTSTSRGVRR
jgi:hypothetical protein